MLQAVLTAILLRKGPGISQEKRNNNNNYLIVFALIHHKPENNYKYLWKVISCQKSRPAQNNRTSSMATRGWSSTSRATTVFLANAVSSSSSSTRNACSRKTSSCRKSTWRRSLLSANLTYFISRGCWLARWNIWWPRYLRSAAKWSPS